jgi:uncharacterized membrane protein
VLVVLVVAFGTALTRVPIGALRLVIGSLLLVLACSGCVRESAG